MVSTLQSPPARLAEPGLRLPAGADGGSGLPGGERPRGPVAGSVPSLNERLQALSVKSRLFGLLTVLGALWLACLFVAISGLSSVKTQASSTIQQFGAFQTERNAYEGWLTDDDQSNMVAALAFVKQSPSVKQLERVTWAQVLQGYGQAQAGLRHLAATAPHAAVRAEARTTLAEMARYDVFTQRVGRAVFAGRPALAVRIMTIENLNASNTTQADFNQLSAALAKDVEQVKSKVTNSVSGSTNNLLVLALVALVFAAGFGSWVIRSITRPLGRVKDVLGFVSDMEAGDLTADIGVSGADPVGQVGDSLQRFVGDLRVRVQTIVANVDGLNGAAAELTATTEQMQAGAEDTSAQARLSRAATEEVDAGVQTVAAAAEELTSSIEEIARSASEAASVAQQAAEVVAATSGTIARLGESSVEIGNIVELITSVAKQTNLLALNATIEAARAGEAGKGFAVVANEVKDLASETTSASQDIARKVGSIQEETGRAVEAVTRIGDIIKRINDLQSAIAAAVEQQSTTTNEIARNATGAAGGASSINQSVAHVAEVAETTNVAVRNATRAAGDLARMSAELQAMVSHFRI